MRKRKRILRGRAKYVLPMLLANVMMLDVSARKHTIITSVTDHHSTKKVLAVRSEQVLLVDIGERILVSECLDRLW